LLVKLSQSEIAMHEVNELYARLKGDAFRKTHPFSDDLRNANELLHNSSAFPDEIIDCILDWCARQQTCQFGKLAANERRIHFCVLSDEAVSRWSDEDIAGQIASEMRLWKQRAAFDIQQAAHSLILVVASPKVALAAPDENLRDFANAILTLSGWSVGKKRFARPLNTISSGFLYLRNPSDRKLYGFQFNVDFFACAGDDRWWHDHRFPAGIAFTANSLGHMRAYREWYGGKAGDGTAWSLKQAMLTIDQAKKHKVIVSGKTLQQDPDGRVTWLLPLSASGEPVVASIPSPLQPMPRTLEGKDWTKYAGYLHTDHAVREEFFQDREAPPTTERPYQMDFTYIYSESQGEFAEFSAGRLFTDDAVFAEIGQPDQWSHRDLSTPETRSRTPEEAALVAQQLAASLDCASAVPDQFLD
jgi:hypothetical protein